jgi:hypothetical protein
MDWYTRAPPTRFADFTSLDARQARLGNRDYAPLLPVAVADQRNTQRLRLQYEDDLHWFSLERVPYKTSNVKESKWRDQELLNLFVHDAFDSSLSFRKCRS